MKKNPSNNVIPMFKYEHMREDAVEKAEERRQRDNPFGILNEDSFKKTKHVVTDLLEKAEEKEQEKLSKLIKQFKESEEVFCLRLYTSTQCMLSKCMKSNNEKKELEVFDIVGNGYFTIPENEIESLEVVTNDNITGFLPNFDSQ